ncbi:SulP family inorganic anion transporter [Streptomyces sp. NPDC020141]|uniref:SulP family inorganic anion transporter n=1 Tax=Streptomyces sp. NPDC020141 TaxID=3365065 RepID=UPI003793ACEB
MRLGAGRHVRKGEGTPPVKSGASPSLKGTFSADFTASIVVFLVALPLCIGVAAASGVNVALGIVTGIVGGLIVGFLPGSSLQVSGPAAGLAVLVLEFVTHHGVALLGPVVLISGLLQIGLGMLRMGRIFQSISVSVVQGMLAGIGVPLILSQIYALVDTPQLGTALKNIAGLPNLAADVLADRQKLLALSLGVMALALCFLWKKVPAPLSKVPAPLVAVILGAGIAALPVFDINKVSFDNMLKAIDFVGPSALGNVIDPAVITMIITFTVIASAESLFSAAAVDRMHTGPRTKYNAELVSQGVGNTICGFLGALPMTAVIVRSAANVQAGAKTKVSRILHGFWLLAFGLLLPGLLGLIPMTVLAGILLHAGWKLFNPPAFVQMWKTDRGEGLVMFITTLAIVVANLLEGVLAGLAVAVILTALRMSKMTIRKTVDGDSARLELSGNATFLRLPRLIDALESISDKSRVCVDATKISHLDLACLSQIEEWADQRRKAGAEEIEILLPGDKAAREAEEARNSQGPDSPDDPDSTDGPGSGTLGEPVAAGLDRPVPAGVPGQGPARPHAPDSEPVYQHSAGPGHPVHGGSHPRQHQHPQPHQHGPGHNNTRPVHPQPHHAQPATHLPHPGHSQPHLTQGYVPPQGYIPPQGYVTPQGYVRPAGPPPQTPPAPAYGQQGYDRPVGEGGQWRPDDGRGSQPFGEGTRR